MMNKAALFLLFILFLAGCTGDYDFGDDIPRQYEPKVVVNSLLCPDSTIRVSLSLTRSPESTENFAPIDGHIELFEEDQLIFSGTSTGGVLETGIHPIESHTYRIRINVEGREEITAQTSIPAKANMMFALRSKVYEYGMRGYVLADVSAIDLPVEARALWISAFYRMENDPTDYIHWSGDLFSTNPYLDPVNCTSDPMDVQLRESNLIYEDNFVRIPKAQHSLAVPFTFSFGVEWFAERIIYPEGFENWTQEEWQQWYEGEGRIPVQQYLEAVVIRLISPSEEYDRYNRTAYQHFLTTSNMSPFMNDPVHVFSNIENGTGIFAGYNVNNLIIPIDNPCKE